MSLERWADGLFERDRFEGQMPGEELVALARRHPFFLLRLWLLPLLILLASLGFAAAQLAAVLAGGSTWLEMGWWAVPISGLGLVVAGLWGSMAFAEWENDQLILTNRRLVVIRQVYRMHEEREEVELARAQDVTVTRRSFLAHALDFGDIEVSTAGAAGLLRFPGARAPSQIKERIFEQRERLRQSQQAERREALRTQLEQALGYPPHGPAH